MNDTEFQTHRKIFFLPMILILLILNIMPVCADETGAESFSDLIARLQEEAVIPAESGRYLSFSDFEDAYANMGYCSVTPLLEADHFVLSANISWSSGSQIPNSMTSGCGVIFNAAENSTDHLMVSMRMDGNLYLSGTRTYNYLSYGKYPIALPSIIGGGNLVLVTDGTQAVVYLDGKRVAQRSDLSDWGDVVGLAVLSGTYQDFGTRCIFSDINVYVW